MDTQDINSVGNPTAPKPKPTASSSRSEASSSPAPAADTVSLSKQGQDLAQPASSSTTAFADNEQRKFSVTENNDVVLEVIDPETQEVVRSVPSEEQLQLRDAIRNELDKI